MILLADSGSTKTDWCLAENGKALKSIKTRGTNPFFQTEDEIAAEIEASLLPELPSNEIDDVFFYGAGCTAEKQPVLEAALRRHLNVKGRLEVASDMLAAARSICGHEPGIACILGTGSNSCLYDGEKLVSCLSTYACALRRNSTSQVPRSLSASTVRRCLTAFLHRSCRSWQRTSRTRASTASW